jgi:hypothetical protein
MEVDLDSFDDDEDEDSQVEGIDYDDERNMRLVLEHFRAPRKFLRDDDDEDKRIPDAVRVLATMRINSRSYSGKSKPHRVTYFSNTSKYLDTILCRSSNYRKLMEHVYKFLEAIWNTEMTFPLDITFKKINPGEQTTNTFNKIVLEDNAEWFKGEFYLSEKV